MRLTQVFKRQFKIARVYGIPVRIDYRWFAIVALSVWLIASNLQGHAMQLGNVRLPPLRSATAWILGVITTAGLFLSVFGHELSHALMARAEGIAIGEIVVEPWGGRARLREEPQNAPADVRVAAAGPAVSMIFAVLAGGVTQDAARDLSVIRLVDDILPLHRQTSFPVAVNDRLHGILSLEDLKSLPRERWANTSVHTVMRPIKPGFFVEPSATLESARVLMRDNGV